MSVGKIKAYVLKPLFETNLSISNFYLKKSFHFGSLFGTSQAKMFMVGLPRFIDSIVYDHGVSMDHVLSYERTCRH